MSTVNLLAKGNRFQRAYYRWALPHYERIGNDDPGLRAEVEDIDQFLYTRRGLLAWLGWLLGLSGSIVGLHRAGMGWAMASGIGLGIWLGLTVAVLAAWLAPASGAKSQSRVVIKRFLQGMAGGAAAAVVGISLNRWARDGQLDWAYLQGFVERVSLVLLLVGAGVALLIAAVAWAGQSARARRLQRLQLMAERDAARASAAETELRLLQVQIHPHFVFNTLATLQHWVDKSDPRAGPLLRELTGFLRRSTEMLGRPRVPLAEEAQSAAHYLAIMQSRMGERLRTQIDIDPRCARQTLPPGLLLTMVENAIEHGLEPKIGGGSLQLHSGCSDTGWWLRVDDDGIGLAADASDNVGLANLRLRLQQHFGDRARFSLSPRPEGGTRAEIRFEETPCPAS